MALPIGWDFGIGIGTSVLNKLAADQIGDGIVTPDATITGITFSTNPAVSPTQLFATVTGNATAGAPIRLVVIVEVSVDVDRTVQAVATEVQDHVYILTINGTEIPTPLNAQEPAVLQAFNSIIPNPLVIVDDVLSPLRRALGINVTPGRDETALIEAAVSVVVTTPRRDGYQDSLLLLMKMIGARDVPSDARSIVRSARDLGVAVPPHVLNDEVFPAALTRVLGTLPATIGDPQRGEATVRSASITARDSALNVDLALTAAGHNVRVLGPIYVFYSQPDGGLWISTRDVTADVEVPPWVWVVVVLAFPLIIGAAIAVGALVVDAIADAAATDMTRSTIADELLDALPGDLGGGRLGDLPTIPRYVELIDGTLYLGSSVFVAPLTVAAVGAVGRRRLRWIQFDNGDVLGVRPAAGLLADGLLVGHRLHDVDRRFLRANHDANTANNLRERGPVDLTLLPRNEQPQVWVDRFLH